MNFTWRFFIVSNAIRDCRVLALSLVRRNGADHFPRLLRRSVLDFSIFRKLLDDAFHHFSAFFDVSHFATPEKHGDLNLVVVLEKANCFLDFEVDVVLASFRADANLFQFGLVSFVLRSPLTLVVLELTEVHDATNRRLGLGSDFDQVETLILGFFECFCGWDNS